MKSPRAIAAAIALFFHTSAPLASANQMEWANKAGGSFQVETNWYPALVPGDMDQATFTLPGAYNVDFADNVSVHIGWINNGVVTQSLGGLNFKAESTYTIAYNPTEARSIIVGGQLLVTNSVGGAVLSIAETGSGGLFTHDTTVRADFVQIGKYWSGAWPALSNVVEINGGAFIANSVDMKAGKIRIAQGTATFQDIRITGGTNAALEATGKLLIGYTGALGPGDVQIQRPDLMYVDPLNANIKTTGMEIGSSSGTWARAVINGGSLTVTNAAGNAELVIANDGIGGLQLIGAKAVVDSTKVAPKAMPPGFSGVLWVMGKESELRTATLSAGPGAAINLLEGGKLEVAGGGALACNLTLDNATARFGGQVTLTPDVHLLGTGVINFDGGLHLPAEDIIVAAGLTINAANITSDGGKLLDAATALRLERPTMETPQTGYFEVRFKTLPRAAHIIYFSTDAKTWRSTVNVNFHIDENGYGVIWEPYDNQAMKFVRIEAIY